MQSHTQSIKFKIILAFGVCVTLMVAIGLFGVFGLSKMNANMSDAYTGSTMPIAQLAQVRAAQLNVRAKLRRLQVSRSVDDVAATVPKIKASLEEIDKNWAAYYPAGVSSDDERRIADRINAGLPELKSLTRTVIEAFVAGNFDAASDAVNRSADLADTVANDLGADITNNLEQAKQAADVSESIYRTILWIAIALIAVGSVAATGVSIYLMRAISVPLNRAVSVANEIADGKLDNQIAVDCRDEFGQLLEALKKMDAGLSNTVRGIKTSAEAVTVASQEIASGNTDLSARTEEQASSLEETAASMTQLTQTVKQNSDNARQANVLATRATDMADAGNEAVQDMVRSIGEVSNSSDKISQITGTIEGIAFQTNILALNAAVEAARAGEQGRGFAVVASEVRSLAQRSAAAAKEIKELIATSVTMIQGSAKQATDVGATMGEVKQAIKQVSDIVGEIAAASEEQSRGIEQVHQAVSQMDEVTQQNAALVEQASAAAQSLEEQSLQLKDAVSVFRLANGGGSGPRVVTPKNRPSIAAPKPAVTRAKLKPTVQAAVVVTGAAAATASGAAGQTWEAF
jgi:methyl-accepting chemotaxis protein